MTTEVLAQALQAGVQATFGQGRVWYLKVASAPLTIIAERQRTGASPRKFINVAAGFKFTAQEGDGWTYLRVLSAVNQNIEIIVGDDDVEVANAVTVSGGVSTQDAPSAAVATPARLTVVNATAQTIAANASRRRITIANPSDNATPGVVYVQAVAAGAGRGYPLDPGMSAEFRTTAALDVRNDSGGSVDVTQFEET